MEEKISGIIIWGVSFQKVPGKDNHKFECCVMMGGNVVAVAKSHGKTTAAK